MPLTESPIGSSILGNFDAISSLLLINCPIHVHGNIIFMMGNIDMIECFLDNGLWESVTFEHWREKHDDLLPYAPDHRKQAWRDKYGIDLLNIWLLNIVAKKPSENIA